MTILDASDYSKEKSQVVYKKPYETVVVSPGGISISVAYATYTTTTITYTWECYRDATNEIDEIPVQNPESLSVVDYKCSQLPSLPRGARYGTYQETWEKTEVAT